MRSDAEQEIKDLLSMATSRRSFRPVWIAIFCLLIAIGAVVFLYGIMAGNTSRTWHAYLVNYLFWFSLAFGIVLYGAVMNMTTADWARPIKRLTEAFGLFLPFSLPMLWLLYIGREEIFTWIREPVPEKSFWLNTPFLFIRNSVGLILLSGVSLVLIYFSVKSKLRVPNDEDHSRIGKA